jgi:2'-5' RNA ligase
MEIQRRLAHRLARNPRDREGDRFLPHFTLARFRSPLQFNFNEGDATLDFPLFAVDSIALVNSTLSSAGARHEPVQVFQLKKP